MDTPTEARARGRDFAPKKRPKQARACATFDAVVEAAARILTADGYAALTVDRIATVAGVGVGSVYEYFTTKESIVAEVVRNVLDDLTAELARTGPLSSTPEAWLREWIRAMFQALRARKALLYTLHHEVPFLDEIEEVRNFPARAFAMATNSPREMTEIPFVNRASIFVITSMVRNAVLESVIDPPEGVSSQELEDTLVEILLALLARSLMAMSRPS